MHFLIQAPNGKVPRSHDFSHLLLRAKEFYDWYGKERLSVTFCRSLRAERISNPDRLVPVGDTRFVSQYLQLFYPDAAERALRPLNVPRLLLPYAGRRIEEMAAPGEDGLRAVFPDSRKLYWKSVSVIKYERNGLYDAGYAPEGEGPWQVSEFIDILSEWRVFVFHDEVRFVANYSGDSLEFPDADTIRAMIQAFRPDAPVAYTLDVAVAWDREEPTRKNTVVMECHRFFSCGTYGFSDLGRYPKMLSQAWHEIKNDPKFKINARNR